MRDRRLPACRCETTAFGSNQGWKPRAAASQLWSASLENESPRKGPTDSHTSRV